MTQRRLFTIACAMCAAALGGGCFLAVFLGGELPDWLLQGELAAFCAVALVYGFFASMPTLTPWLWSRPIRGAALVCLGVGAVFVPLEFVLAAMLIGVGTRLVWASACDLKQEEEEPPARAEADDAAPQIDVASWPDVAVANQFPTLTRLP